MASSSLTTASALFKTKYVRLDRDMFNSEDPVKAKIKRNDEFVGEFARLSVPTSFGGGIGAGSFPRPNPATYIRMDIYAKKTYAIIQVDRESIKAAETDQGAFVRLTKENVKRGIQSWNRQWSTWFWTDSLTTSQNGALGCFSGNQTLAAADTYTVTVTGLNSAASGKTANFEVKDYVSVNTNDSTLFEITAVTLSAGIISTITLVKREGPTVDLAAVGTGTHFMYLQQSRGNAPTGLRGVLLATSSTLYGNTVGRRWQAASQMTSLSAGLTTDLMNQQVMELKEGFGEAGDMMVTSFTQYRRLLDQLEDQKRYMVVESRSEGNKGKFSFQALEYMADTGPIPVFADRFVEPDTFYTLNSDFIEMHVRPDAGWIDEDITGIFRNSATDDVLEARYAVYYEMGIHPTPHGIMTGLLTS